eukprot:6491222-Amphidinium_carterae.1
MLRLTSREFHAVALAPPCSTFSSDGPASLRGIDGKDIYGFPWLRGRDVATVKLGTLLALRSIAVMKLCLMSNIPFVYESTWPQPGSVHMTVLPEFDLIRHTNSYDLKWHRCDERILGASVPTLLIAFRVKLAPQNLKKVYCKATSLCEHLAGALIDAAMFSREVPPEQQTQLEAPAHAFGQVHFTASLRGSQQPSKVQIQEADTQHYLGGLRRAQVSLNLLPNGIRTGMKIRLVLLKLLRDDSSLELGCHRALMTANDSFSGPSDAQLLRVRTALCALSQICLSDAASELCTLWPGLFQMWISLSGDSDVYVPLWLRQGAPMALRLPVPSAGIFPPREEDENLADLDTLVAGDLGDDIESAPHAESEFHEYERLGFVKRFNSLCELESFLGQPPVLSRIHVLVKQIGLQCKLRTIFDAKASGLSAATANPEKVMLPRIVDVVTDAMHMLRRLETTSVPQMLVLDFTQAFWQIPIAPSERRHFCTRVGSSYFAYLRVAQGSRAGPLIWARVISQVMRLSQAVLGQDAHINCYVDDPLVLLGKDHRTNMRLASFLVILWRALGFPVAFQKAQFGTTVSWTSAVLSISRDALTVSIKPSLVAETLQLLRHPSGNLVSVKLLRKVTGKLSHISSMLPALRPFVQPLWAALHTDSAHGAPPGHVWRKQIQHAITWLDAFLTNSVGQLERTYVVSDYFAQGADVMLATDACSTGLGGFLAVQGRIIEFFHDVVTEEDRNRFQQDLSSKGQQLWEALALLVALRVWHRHWATARCRLLVRGDSVTALTLLVRFTTAPTTSLVARELALDVMLAHYPPIVAEHVPGIAHSTCDALSRYTPGSPLPACLASAQLVQPPARTDAFFRTL